MAVFVLDNDGKPLMPCSEKRARILLESGKARLHRFRPFSICMNDKGHGRDLRQDLTLKISPGSKSTGFAIVSQLLGSFFLPNSFIAASVLWKPYKADQNAASADAPPFVTVLTVSRIGVREVDGFHPRLCIGWKRSRLGFVALWSLRRSTRLLRKLLHSSRKGSRWHSQSNRVNKKIDEPQKRGTVCIPGGDANASTAGIKTPAWNSIT
jgi:hypothetical protein